MTTSHPGSTRCVTGSSASHGPDTCAKISTSVCDSRNSASWWTAPAAPPRSSQAAESFPRVMLVVVVGEYLAQADDIHEREHGSGDRNRIGGHPQVEGIWCGQLCFGGPDVPEDRTVAYPDQCVGDVCVPPGIEGLPDVADRETCVPQPDDEQCLRDPVGRVEPVAGGGIGRHRDEDTVCPVVPGRPYTDAGELGEGTYSETMAVIHDSRRQSDTVAGSMAEAEYSGPGVRSSTRGRPVQTEEKILVPI